MCLITSRFSSDCDGPPFFPPLPPPPPLPDDAEGDDDDDDDEGDDDGPSAGGGELRGFSMACCMGWMTTDQSSITLPSSSTS